jgi:hypothetical protein
MNGDLSGAFHATLDALAGTLAPMVPYGTIAAGVIELFNHFGAEPATSTINWADWKSVFHPYNPGPSGSFESFANTTMEAQWSALATQMSAHDREQALISMFAAAVKKWNDTHQGPPAPLTVSDFPIPKGGNQWGFTGSNWTPIAIAVRDMLQSSDALHPGASFTTQINSGPAITASAPTPGPSHSVWSAGPVILQF